MDLNKHIVADWATMRIEDAEIDLYGRDSAKFKSMIHEFDRTRDKSKEDSVAEIEKRAFDRVVMMTKDIRGIELDGKPVKDANELYTLAPGVYEQALEFLNRRSNFLPKA